MDGKDGIGWALDTDFYLIQEAIKNNFNICKSIISADAIITVWSNSFYKKYKDVKFDIPVLLCFQGNPNRLFDTTPGFESYCKDKICIAQSLEAFEILKNKGIKELYLVPYIADKENYCAITDKSELRKKYGITDDMFIVSNFMRDTEYNTNQPKLEKGPDIFVEIIQQLKDMLPDKKIVPLLAGPRRQYVLNCLHDKGIKYIYIGKETPEEDYSINLLSKQKLNELYNCSNLHLITSRSEGGPRAVMEAICSRTPVISTKVGIAPDIIDSKYLYNDIEEGARKCAEFIIAEQDYDFEGAINKIQKNHSTYEASRRYKDIFDNVCTNKTRPFNGMSQVQMMVAKLKRKYKK